ncbi:MAG: hypothetical protein QXT45_05710 [Candidatus Bilamarchaeaceae archaeon]
MRLIRRNCWGLPGWASELSTASLVNCPVYLCKKMIAANYFDQCLAVDDADTIIRCLMNDIRRRIVSTSMVYDDVIIVMNYRKLMDGIGRG